jgi:hypothetical protein
VPERAGDGAAEDSSREQPAPETDLNIGLPSRRDRRYAEDKGNGEGELRSEDGREQAKSQSG